MDAHREGKLNEDASLSGQPRTATSLAEAVAAAYEASAGLAPERAFVCLAWELELRGVDPDPAAIFDAAQLISRGQCPPTTWAPVRGRRRKVL